MDEHDVVFGAEDRLRDAIEELDRSREPDIIVVLSCCASGIIGEDLENACRAARTRARVIPIEAGGFSGDFSAGYAATLEALVSRTAKRGVEKEKGTVNLVGMLRSARTSGRYGGSSPSSEFLSVPLYRQGLHWRTCRMQAGQS